MAKVGEKVSSIVIERIPTLKEMTLSEIVGQLLFIGVPNNALSENQTILSAIKPGGLILFSRNIATLEQTVHDINLYQSGLSLPLFIGVDQEGGRVSRLPHSWARKFPAARVVGQNPHTAQELAECLGTELKALGINMNFAPVLDIDSNPDNPVIGDRSFGTTPQIVSAVGRAVIAGLNEALVIPVIKHFPGHGNTSIDSHKAVAVVTATLELMEKRELEPFRQAIVAGAPAVMIGHLLVPVLDPERIATVSPIIVNDLLRQKMGFSGVVITDDLEMGAIDQVNIGEIAVQAILAGVDLLLVCHSFSKQLAVRDALLAAVESGRITMERLHESLTRILALKERYHISKSEVDINQAHRIVGSTEHHLLASSIHKLIV